MTVDHIVFLVLDASMVAVMVIGARLEQACERFVSQSMSQHFIFGEQYNPRFYLAKRDEYVQAYWNRLFHR